MQSLNFMFSQPKKEKEKKRISNDCLKDRLLVDRKEEKFFVIDSTPLPNLGNEFLHTEHLLNRGTLHPSSIGATSGRAESCTVPSSTLIFL